MLIRFSSPEAGAITMFGDVAAELLKMMGASGRVPGALRAEDIAPAVLRLRRELASQVPAKPIPADAASEFDPAAEPPIALSTRAAPLLDLLERARAGQSAVTWEAA